MLPVLLSLELTQPTLVRQALCSVPATACIWRCRQELEAQEEALELLESALEEARAHARSAEQKTTIVGKELKVSDSLSSSCHGLHLHSSATAI